MSAEPAREQEVLIVEDDAAIAEGLALNLRLQGYRSDVAEDAETAHARIQAQPPDLVLLDITLPGKSGLWVLSQLRDAGNHVPVIVLSARQDEHDKVAALRLGADDYVTKPFALAELLARVVAVLRRAGGGRESAAAAQPQRVLGFADVLIELEARTVTRGGEALKLTHLEFELLVFLVRNAWRVLAREEILRAVWQQTAGTPRTVDNFIAQLRAKLEEDPEHPRHIVTVRGSGYRFAP
jgi:two-component system, OmpR family, alkaline phosphatase synthesis response regulator PhoP